ncbi:hypothetical protein ACHHYP_11474 [Achlya hypogyna]|uniref:Uncharacterized protein n=1 Tax=Achlya hypogyna TaxID=1202772 RepID=A0A1V9YJ12_ACHHY|nr:hypothetical protein ACHHYP_11474 [Achlya hypogyna]
MTPLYLASYYGHVKVVQYLVDAGADLQLAADDGATPLHAASSQGHDTIVGLLLAVGAMINNDKRGGATPLYFACKKGHDAVVQRLIAAGANVNLPENIGSTPLYIASQCGNYSTVEYLLNADASVDQCSKDGWTPLYNASYYGHYAIVEKLLQAGADIDLSANVRAVSRSPFTPILSTRMEQHRCMLHVTKATRQLLGYFWQPEPASTWGNSYDNATPLYNASQRGHHAFVELLFASGADVNQSIDVSRAKRSRNGTTPLCIASQNGHDSVVRRLLDARASINEPKTVDGHHCITQAITDTTMWFKVFSMVVPTSTKLEMFDGGTPLHAASYKGHETIVGLLLAANADVNAQKPDGVTPLYYACQCGHDAIVERLLAAGADANQASVVCFCGVPADNDAV